MLYSVFTSVFCNTSVHIFIFVNRSRPFNGDGEVSIIPFVFLSPFFHSPVFLCHPFCLSSSSSFDLMYLTNCASGFFKRDTKWFFIIYRLWLQYYREKISLKFVDPCIIVQFIQKNPTRCKNVLKFYYSIFIWSSTGFGRKTAYHQEPKTTLATSGFLYVKGCWTCRWWTPKNLSRIKTLRLPVQF
jgi:hypothetical protein